MPLTKSEREHAGAMEVTHREEVSVVAKEAEGAEEAEVA
jgi:hypothetical protein